MHFNVPLNTIKVEENDPAIQKMHFNVLLNTIKVEKNNFATHKGCI